MFEKVERFRWTEREEQSPFIVIQDRDGTSAR